MFNKSLYINVYEFTCLSIIERKQATFRGFKRQISDKKYPVSGYSLPPIPSCPVGGEFDFKGVCRACLAGLEDMRVHILCNRRACVS